MNLAARLVLIASAGAAAGAAGCAPGRGDDVLIWHAYDGAERRALEEVVDGWNQAHPERGARLVAVPYDAFADKLTSAIPNGNGPDLFIYNQDRLGDWARSGTIEPIGFWVDAAVADRFVTRASGGDAGSDPLAALVEGDQLYGLPLAVKSLALFYRTDQVPVPPRTTDDLLAMADTRRAAGQGGYPMAYASADLYGHAPWLHGFGGRVLADDGSLAIATPAATAAAELARTFIDRRVAPAEAEPALVASLFNQGMAAMAVSGPWFVGDIAAGVPWAVTTLPIISATGQPAAPFLGAEAVLMSSHAVDKAAAYAVMDHLAGDASATIRARRGRQIVPNPAAYADPELAADPVLAAFRAQLATTVAMPSAPAMRLVWTPYKTALADILGHRAEAGARLWAAQQEIEGYLRGARR